MVACITVAGRSDANHVKTVFKQIISSMSDKKVVPSSNSNKIHCVKIEGSAKFPAKHDKWHSRLHGLVKSFSKGKMEKTSGLQAAGQDWQ